MIVLKKITRKGTWHSKLDKFNISNLWDRPSLESMECPFLAVFIQERSKSLNLTPHKEGQVALAPQNEKGPSTSPGPHLSTFTAREMQN